MTAPAAAATAAPVTVVVKIGTSSITDARGVISESAIAKLCLEVAERRRKGDRVVIVTSGAIAAGLPALGLSEHPPTDAPTLQAISAVGMSRLLRVYDDALGGNGLVGGQCLLAPLDFVDRKHYLHARQTLGRLLELGVVPIVNENDAIADDEVRFGDNDRLAALVAHMVRAQVLVLLTDAPGLLTADPRFDATASLIDEIVEVDQALEAVAGRSANPRGSGGMASKLAAAKIASWSGVRAVIAAADRPGVLGEAVEGVAGVGTVVHPRDVRLSARKLWIAFAVGASGTVVVDDGARSALVLRATSLLPAGVVAVEGSFDADDAVEIAGLDGRVFAKGLVRHPAARVKEWAGQRTSALPPDFAHEVVHRDDLVVLP
ncbi:MAG TPA: glutamate 5-kinase [Acidimicrobiales bacterium]|jgi:glutamate 5-kinase|nr:glutamate 5-kinase [Acidimicrobiales bacterium]